MKRILYTLLILISFCGQIKPAQAHQITDKEYILLLSSINFNEAWSKRFYNVFKEEFNTKIPVYGEELMIPTMQNSEQVTELRDSLIRKYEYPPKLIVFIGDPGWVALKPLFDNRWKDVPVIICYARNEVPSNIESLISENKGMGSLIDRKQSIEGYNVTTIEQPFFVKGTIELMRELMPSMKKIAFIRDQRYISLSAGAELEKVVKSDFPELKLEYLTSPDISSEKLLDTISRYDASVGIVYYSWFLPSLDKQQKYLNDHIQKVLFGFANTPIFTLADQNPESGNFAGGYYVSMDDVNKQAIEIAKDILNGKVENKTISIDLSRATKYLNYHHLQHHNVDPALYPQDAVYFQAPPSPFAKYKVRIIALFSLLILILIVCVFVTVLYMQKNRQRERQLKLSAQYRKMVENMPMPYLRKELIRKSDGEITDYRFLDMNPAFEKLVGCTRDCIAGKTLSDGEIKCPTLREVTNKSANSDYDLSLSDDKGNKVYYELLEFSDKNQNIIETFFIDKTAAYREKQKTEEYHRFLQSILDNLPIATKVNDMNDDLRCIYWNKKASELFRTSARDILKEPILQIDDQAMESVDNIDTNILKGEHWEGVHKYLHIDGKIHSLLVTRHALDHMESKKWLLSSAIDITEIQENRQTLEHLNNQYRLVLQCTRLIVVSWDIPSNIISGNVKYAVRNFFNKTDSFTMPSEEYFENIHPSDIGNVSELFRKLINGEQDIIEIEYRLLDRINAHYRWVNGYATVGERDESGNPLTIVGAIRDIDEHKLMEEELKRAKEKAEESNRLKSAFLANMSHEIRTPLNAIVGFSGILANVDDENEKREFIHIIENNNRLLLQLIGDILDISKIESGTLEFIFADTDIHNLCNEVYHTANLRLNENKRVTLTFEEHTPELIVYTESNRLMQVLHNLLTNAIKFTEEGTISMGYRLQDDDTIEFYVSDTGCGIPADQIDTIFGRFVKLDSFVQGTGLGLSICQTIVERLGGRISIESEPGKGSTFRFTIPNTPSENNRTKQA